MFLRWGRGRGRGKWGESGGTGESKKADRDSRKMDSRVGVGKMEGWWKSNSSFRSLDE